MKKVGVRMKIFITWANAAMPFFGMKFLYNYGLRPHRHKSRQTGY
jgi:hypothetical protein